MGNMTPATRNRPDVLRLAAAAALQTHGDYSPVDAWILSGKMPDRVQRRLEKAGRWPIRSQARESVLAIVQRWKLLDALAPYPSFAEPSR